jgi:hypothetical protein
MACMPRMPMNFVLPSKMGAQSKARPVPAWSELYALSCVAKMSWTPSPSTSPMATFWS